MLIDPQTDSPVNHNARRGTITNHSKKGQSQSNATYSTSSAASPFSPQDSLTYNAESPINSTSMETSPMSSPSVQPTLDPSVVAVHGSVPSSPNLQGVRGDRLKESAYFALPRPRNANKSTAIDCSNGGAGGAKQDWHTAGATTSPVAPIPAPMTGKESNLQVYTNALDAAQSQSEAPLPDHVRRTVKNGRVLAIDFDDVCSQSTLAMCLEMNAKFGTDITPEDVETYAYFQNRGFGSPAEAEQKLHQLGCFLPKTLPVPGFASALKHLHALGHPIHIVTVRPQSDYAAVIHWLAQQGITVGLGDDDEVAAVWFTGSYGFQHEVAVEKGDETLEEANQRLKERWKDNIGQGKGGLAKLKVLRAINAALFIDDHHGNLEPIIKADPPVTCLLFGAYKWNAAKSGVSSPVELMSYEERMDAGVRIPKADIDFDGGFLHRVKGWEEVIEWIKRWDVPRLERTETA